MKERTPPGRSSNLPKRRRTAQGRTPPRANAQRSKRTAKPPNEHGTIRKRGNVYYVFHNERRRIPWKLIFALLLVFFGGIGSAVTYANNHEIRREINISRNRLNSQLATNRSLLADTTERYSHDEIVRRARAMGMGEPDPSQIIYFYAAPLHSSVVFTYNPASNQDNNFWQGLAEFFRGMGNRVFG